MRCTLSQSCCAVLGPKDAFVPGSSLSVGSSGANSFDQGTVCNTVRYPPFSWARCKAPARCFTYYTCGKKGSLRGEQLGFNSARRRAFSRAVCARSTTGFFFVQTTCGTFPAVSNQALSSFFAYRAYSASNCDSFLGTTYYGSGHTSATRVRHHLY